MSLSIIESSGWHQVGTARAARSWGQLVRLSQVPRHRTLADEKNAALNDVLFDRRGADPALADELAERFRQAGAALEAFARDAGGWPDWLGMAQGGGLAKWDPFIEFDLSLPLVDDRFTDPLRTAGIDAGWRTEAIPVFDKKWQPVDSHRAFIVSATLCRADVEVEHHEVLLCAETLPEPGAAPPFAWIDRSRCLVASQETSRVLKAAKLPGLALKPVRAVER